MDNKYKLIRPEDVFVSIFDREATEEEMWMGLPRHFEGNRPTGNNFMDLFARLVRQYQCRDIVFYAELMGIPDQFFGKAIRAMSGMSAVAWRDRYTILSACELLAKSDDSITDIAKRLGFSTASSFCHYFLKHSKSTPREWRRRHQ